MLPYRMIVSVLCLGLVACKAGPAPHTAQTPAQSASANEPVAESPSPTPASTPVADKYAQLYAPPPLDNDTPPAVPDKELRVVTHEAPQTIGRSGIYDLQNDASVVLQDPIEALKEFPLDRRQGVDWVAAERGKLINPRADVTGKGSMVTMDLDIVMKNTIGMAAVRFPHKIHTEWLDCANCHPAIFIPKAKGNPVDMTKILRGEYCGVCHDKVAFSLFICERCHNTPLARAAEE